MDVFTVIALLAAIILFLLATWTWPIKINLVALGLACWVLVPLVHAIKAL